MNTKVEMVKAQLGLARSFKKSLKNFETEKKRNNSSKIKNGAYVVNLDEFKSIGTPWIVLYVNSNNIIYFKNFRVEHIAEEI